MAFFAPYSRITIGTPCLHSQKGWGGVGWVMAAAAAAAAAVTVVVVLVVVEAAAIDECQGGY